MARAGWHIPSPPASMFAWAPMPGSHSRARLAGVRQALLIEAEVAVAPGVGFGEYGEGYVRIGLVENEQRIRQAARNVKKFLGDIEPPLRALAAAMEQVLRVGVAGLGTVGGGVLTCCRRTRHPGFGPAAARTHRRLGALRTRKPRREFRPALRLDPMALADLADTDVFVELIGGGMAPPRGRSRAKAKKHVVTANKALLAYHGAKLAALAESNGVVAEVRGRGLRRHSHRQGVARKSDRLRDLGAARHPERHLQLHPDPDGSDRAAFRRRARRSPAPGLRRSRSRRSTSAAATPPTS